MTSKALIFASLLCILGSQGSFAQGSFTFGESPFEVVETVSDIDLFAPEFSVDITTEAYAYTNNGSDTDLGTKFAIAPEVALRISEALDMKLSGMLTRLSENGGRDFTDAYLDYAENFIRWSNETARITLGAQKAVWGSVDGLKPTDQLGSQDFRRFVVDDFEDRRQAVPALRGELTQGDFKLDGLFSFTFRESEMADRESIWTPVDVRGGRVLGVAIPTGLGAVFQNASFGDDDNGVGGGGIRLSKSGEAFDAALTMQRVRRSVPFYEVNPALLNAVSAGTPLTTALATTPGKTVTAKHPWQTVLGGDIAVPFGSSVFRAEAAWLDNTPVYRSDLSTEHTQTLQAVAGVEFYPGDAETRVIVQGFAQIHNTEAPLLERDEIYSLNGSVENSFDNERWAAGADYSIGIDTYDLYLNPYVSYQGIDGHNIYVEGHFFDGDNQTAGDFYQDNSFIMIGWKATF